MAKNLKVLMVSTEVNPYSKSGGLGDVAGSLPKALRKKKVDARVVLPLYKSVPANLIENASVVAQFTVHLSWRSQEATILALDENGKGDMVYFIKNDFYFYRDGYYGYGDDFERFAFFTKASIEMLHHIGYMPDIMHFNDWHTGLGPTYLRDIYRQFSDFAHIKSLFSIHNLNYQGIFGREILWEVGLNDGYYTSGDLEFNGNISFLKAGILHADAVSTVSETYAREIQTPSYGYGMNGLLYQKGTVEGKLFGITNGIDTVEHNPKTDKRMFVKYDENSLDKKRENKHRLQESLGLPVSDVPMFAMITRLAEQKGFDIMSIILDELLSKDIQLVVLGTGEERYENMLREFAWRYHGKLSANITFDATLAQRIYAGADMFMMPSVFEPCGLGQLFAMRHGTIPIVRKTGGLADTVQHFNPHTGTGNGFLFEDYVASGLMWAINESLNVYHSENWSTLVKNAITGDYSWAMAAEKYVNVYNTLL